MLVHQVFIGHDEERRFVPGRSEFLHTGQAFLPSASLASDLERFHQVAKLRSVAGFDRSWTPWRPARDWFMLERAHELLMG
ncbi:MAG TPA: hypothetical protein VFL31_04095 [Nitrospiraceae bacterium]|nr:hypothetical protein [Nitrospiraceae bacterium]